MPYVPLIRRLCFSIKKRGTISVYFLRGIAKRLKHNKQSTPRRADISVPLAGVDIGKHERFFDCFDPVLEIFWRIS